MLLSSHHHMTDIACPHILTARQYASLLAYAVLSRRDPFVSRSSRMVLHA